MKRIVLIYYFILFFNSVSFSANWLWANHYGGNAEDDGYSVCTDHFGNLYAAGMFYSDTANFGIDSLYNRGFYIASYDRDGHERWTRQGQYFSLGEIGGITTDPAGNVYVSGYFYAMCIFGNDTLTGTGTDIFIVK